MNSKERVQVLKDRLVNGFDSEQFIDFVNLLEKKKFLTKVTSYSANLVLLADDRLNIWIIFAQNTSRSVFIDTTATKSINDCAINLTFPMDSKTYNKLVKFFINVTDKRIDFYNEFVHNSKDNTNGDYLTCKHL